MRVLIGAFGTRGDVQPMLGLAQGLLRRGHVPQVVVPPPLVPLARRLGFDATGVGVDYDELMRAVVDGSWSALRSVMPRMRDETHPQLAGLEPLAASADVIVGSSVFTVGSVLADRFQKPYALFALFPQVFPSRYHATPMLRWQQLPGAINRLSWRLNSFMWDRLMRKVLNDARRERGLSSIAEVWPTIVGHHPVAAFDPLIAEAPTDYPTPIKQVGALVADDPQELSAEVTRFLAEGQPPVYAGFGSMFDADPARTTERIIDAIQQADARAIVAVGAAGLASARSSREVLFVADEPHVKLFPRCATIVHHGGAGTTHAAARAGVPQVLMPQMLDQHYWAWRLERLGVSAGTVARHGGSGSVLAKAIRRGLEDPSLRARAQAVAQELVPDGAERAVRFVESLAQPPDAGVGGRSEARA